MLLGIIIIIIINPLSIFLQAVPNAGCSLQPLHLKSCQRILTIPNEVVF